MGERFDIAGFLEEYQRFPCLWKKLHPDFKNRLIRDNAEETLLPLSGLGSIKELRQKIRNIRCTYNQEVYKIKQSMATATGAEDLYRPKLAWFSLADSFLRQNLQENDSESYLTLPEIPLEGVVWSENHTEVREPSLSQSQETPTISQANRLSPQRFRKRPVCSNPRTRKNNKIVKVFQQVAANRSSSVSEFTAFGQHVVSQLEALPLEEAIILQWDIQQIITAARLRNLRGSEPRDFIPRSNSSCSTPFLQPTPQVLSNAPFSPLVAESQDNDVDVRRTSEDTCVHNGKIVH